MEQSRLIQEVIMNSFTFLCASIILQHAFPDTLLTANFVTRALVSATQKDAAATLLCRRILNNHTYQSKITILVCCSSWWVV